MRGLLMAFLVTLFIPRAIALDIGSLSLTPALVVSIFLFPTLIFTGKMKWAFPDTVLVMFFTAAFYSTLRSVEASRAIESFGRGLLLSVVPYLMGRYLGVRPKLFNLFMRRTMTVMAVLGVLTLLESFFRFNIHAVLWNQPYDPHHQQRLGLTRAYGWTSHSIMLGISFAVFVPVMAIAARERIKHLGNYCWLKVGLLLVGVFCSLSTGAWGPAVVALCLVCWDYFAPFKPGTRWLIVFVGGSATWFILEVLSGRPLLRILMMELHLSSPMAWHYRWELYRRIYAVMPGFEWFGHGINTPAAIANSFQWSIDNHYLVVLMQYGRVGLTLWLGLLAAVLIYGWKSVWNGSDTSYRRIARALLIALVAVALTQLSVALFSTAAMLNWLFLGLGVGMAQSLRADEDRAKKARPSPGGRR